MTTEGNKTSGQSTRRTKVVKLYGASTDAEVMEVDGYVVSAGNTVHAVCIKKNGSYKLIPIFDLRVIK